MNLPLFYSYAAIVGIFAGSANAADGPLVMKDRSYYAYGYEAGTTEGAPDG